MVAPASRPLRAARQLVLAAVACVLAAQAAATAAVTAADYAALAASVGNPQTDGFTASPLTLSGPALAVVAEGSSAVVAATIYDMGRVVVFGHEGMLDACCTSSGLGRLVRNAAGWAAGAKTSGIRLAGGSSWAADIAVSLVNQSPTKFTTVGQVSLATLSKSSVDVLILNGQDGAVGVNAAAIRSFIQAGGGVVLGAQAWYWSYSNRLMDHPSNKLLAPLGVLISAGTASISPILDSTSPPSQQANLEVALGCLEDSCTGKTKSACYIRSEAGMTAAVRAIVSGAELMPVGSSFWARLDQWAARAATSTTGINPDSPIQRRSMEGLGAIARTIRYKYLPPGQLPASPDAKFFPGLPAAGTKPITTAVSRTINGTTEGEYWQCLGMYAMPGTVVKVAVPNSIASLGSARLHIGGWTDTLYEQTEWARLPEIVRVYPVTSTTTSIGSALGGLIYITLPAGLRLGNVKVSVAGAIRAPMYQKGVSTVISWATDKIHPAPWGEISSRKLAIASPRSSLQKVSSAAAVADYWDKVMDAQALMANISPVRPTPMRFQHDVQISAGYMHSGYPIMTWMDVVDSTLDPKEGKWGHFHELGHNHQQGAWTWECTGEVTCNFFSAFTMWMVHNMTDPRNFYGWYGDLTSRYAARRAYFAAGADHRKLCEDPGLYLDSFFQVAEDSGLGLKLIRDTIRSYKGLASQPETNSDKIQTWVMLSSKAANRNFAAYYKAWGWPVTAETEAALAALPPYRPRSPQPPPVVRPPPPAPPPAPTPAMAAADYAALAVNVGTIQTSAFTASPLLLHGPALAVAVAPSGEVLVAAAKYSAGRVVMFSHEGMLDACCTSGGLGRLVRNAAGWAAGAKTSGIRVAGGNSWAADIAGSLVNQSPKRYTTVGVLDTAAITVRDADVLILDGQDGALDTNADNIRRFVAQGGGVVLGAQAWYWSYENPVADHPSNKLLAPLGIVVSSDAVQLDATLSPNAPPSQLGNADVALRCLMDSCAGNTGSFCYTTAAGIITSYRSFCARVDDYIPAGAAYRSTLQKWVAKGSGTDMSKAACAAVQSLVPS